MLRHCSISGLLSVVACGLVVGGLTTFSPSASACSYVVSSVRDTDSSLLGQEDIAPQLLDVDVQRLNRGRGPAQQVGENGVELLVVSSCGDIASMTLAVVAEDEQTPFSDLRYTIEVVRGEAPMQLGSGAFATVREGELLFAWAESPELGELPLDFEVRVTAVDQAGNQSEPFFLDITDPGTLFVAGNTVDAGDAKDVVGTGRSEPNATATDEAVDDAANATVSDGDLLLDSTPERSLPAACTTSPLPSSPGSSAAAFGILSLLALLGHCRRR